MAHTKKREDRIKARFRQTMRYQVALIVPLGGAVILLAGADRYSVDVGLQAILLAAALLVLVAAGFSWLNWRCPACRKHLGRSLRPSRCPRCGVTLRSP
jgi:O-antigen/teichoic acid export membrane protein